MKKIKASNIVLSVIVLTLAVLSYLNIINNKVALPIAIFLLGITNILNGYSAYIKNRKGEGIFSILSGLFVIFVSIFTAF